MNLHERVNMNPKLIDFIICTNNELYLNECIKYIQSLEVPEGFSIKTSVIRGAESLASAYQKGMEESDAKYKVYLHQDTFVIKKSMLNEAISLFEKYPELGMLGVVGIEKLPPSAIMWEEPGKRCGKVVSDLIKTTKVFEGRPVTGEYQEVQAIDGLFMMTQYDIPWRYDLFTGWDLYDLSQSMEFQRAGYKVGVPKQETPWCLHDKDIINLEGYEQYRQIFLKEYQACLFTKAAQK